MDPYQLRKETGELEAFDPDKLKASLLNVGAPEETTEELAREITDDSNLRLSSKHIRDYIFSKLKEKDRVIAARYNMRHALAELGPSGYPFEKFVAAVFQHEGYQVGINQMIPGKCVQHEIDVVAEKDGKKHMIEVKFHNQGNYKSGVKVPLYVKARFDDIKMRGFDFGWLVTNTKFSQDAIRYGECVELNLLSWEYPEESSLSVLIDKHSLHPITAITQLSKKNKQEIMEKGIVLCKQLIENPGILAEIQINAALSDSIIQEAQGISQN